jgi:hypothetical protein
MELGKVTELDAPNDGHEMETVLLDVDMLYVLRKLENIHEDGEAIARRLIGC